MGKHSDLDNSKFLTDSVMENNTLNLSSIDPNLQATRNQGFGIIATQIFQHIFTAYEKMKGRDDNRQSLGKNTSCGAET